MISAAEAGKLFKASEAEFNNIINKIDEQIQIAAKAGKRSLNLSELFHSWDKFQITEFNNDASKSPKLTDFQKKLKGELKFYNYDFQIVYKTVKVGGGLGIMSEDNQEYEEIYNIVINW